MRSEKKSLQRSISLSTLFFLLGPLTSFLTTEKAKLLFNARRVLREKHMLISRGITVPFQALNCSLKWIYCGNTKTTFGRKDSRTQQRYEGMTRPKKGVKEEENWVFQFSAFLFVRSMFVRVVQRCRVCTERKTNSNKGRMEKALFEIDWLRINSFNCNYFSLMKREIGVCAQRENSKRQETGERTT